MIQLKKTFFRGIIYLIVLLGVLLMLMPFAWMIMTSFKLNGEVEAWPPRWTSDAFSLHRELNLKLVRSEGVSIDFSSLTIEEFFNLNTIIQSQSSGETPLIYTINDDPPYRGELMLDLSANGNRVDYTKEMSAEDAGRMQDILDEISPLPPELTETISNMQMIEDPVLRLNAIMNYLYYKPDSPLSRRNITGALDETMEAVNAFREENKEKLLNHSSFSEDAGESAEEKTKRLRTKEYAERVLNTIDTKIGRMKVFLNDFEKGESILSIAEIAELHSKMNAIFSFGPPPVDFRENAVLRLINKNIILPLNANMNTVRLGKDIYSFYEALQVSELTETQLVMRFKDKEDVKRDVLEKIEESSFSAQEKDLVEKVIHRNFEKSTNLLFRELDQRYEDELAEAGVSKEGIAKALASIKTISNNLDTALVENTNLRDDIRENLRNGQSVNSMIESSLLPETQKKILLDNINRTLSILKNEGLNEETIYRLIDQRYEMDTFSKYYTNLFSRSYSEMALVEAPEIVKSVRYKNLRSIEVELEGINPIWFWDEEPALEVDYTAMQMLANVFQNYVNAWKAGKYFGYYYFNTVFVALVTTLLDIVFASMAAFAFSKLKFFGKNFIFMTFLATMMVPGEVLLVPNYITLSAFGWIDTYLALIVPWTVSVFVIFLIRQHFMSIPDELYDAGRIDGISKWGFLWKVMVPLSKPVIITGSLLKFIGSWNAFLWVLIVTKSPEVRTLPVGLANFRSDVGTMFNQLMAASTFSMLPVVILFLFVQKYFIQGIARTGLK